MMHEIVVDKADSGLTIEYTPVGLIPQKIMLLLDYERMPTRKRYLAAAFASDNSTTTTWNTKGGTRKSISTFIVEIYS